MNGFQELPELRLNVLGVKVRIGIKRSAMSNDQWKTIEEFPEFAINQCGVVRRVHRCQHSIGCTRHPIGMIKKPRLNRGGYFTISFKAPRERRVHLRTVASLVAKSFLGSKPTHRHQVNHIDLNKTNDHLSNLEWVTPRENILHAIQHGHWRKSAITTCHPERRHYSKGLCQTCYNTQRAAERKYRYHTDPVYRATLLTSQKTKRLSLMVTGS